MNTLSIPEGEMSLFANRDLLDSFESAVIGLDGPFSQDGVKSSLATLVYSAEPSGHGISMDFQATGMDQDSFSSEWFDTKTDLLQYLTGVELEPADNTDVEIPEVQQIKPTMEVQAMPAPPQDSTETAVSILKSLVEDTCQQLSSELPVEAPPNEVPEVTMADLDLKEEDMQLLDLLAQSMQDTSDVMADASILSPISYDEVDSILSSGPCSPLADSNSCIADCSQSSVGDASVGSVDMSLDLARLLTQVQSQSASSSVTFSPAASSDSEPDTSLSDPDYAPFSSPECSGSDKAKSKSKRSVKRLDPETKLLERKLRKKQQNKDAATRYRQKKRAESGVIEDEVTLLERRNKMLQDNVDQVTKEISYIKNLLAEVYKAKGLI